MFKRLYNIYRSETEKTQLAVFVVISFICLLVYYDFSQAIWKGIVQLGMTWLLAYVYKTYLNKDSGYSQIQVWKFFYIIWLVVMVLMWIIG